jgi:alginate O-acetyltransferase complex protein AlgI
MTLSRFLRDYLYIALGGNRKGAARRYINLFLTMLLGGIWHGAGWTFVMWGALHGSYLMVNHGWHALWNRVRPPQSKSGSIVGNILGVAITFLAVVVGWVFFRADSMGTATSLLATMSGLHGIQLPAVLASASWPAEFLSGWVQFLPGSAAYGHVQGGLPLLFIGLLLAWCWFLPNAQQIFSRFQTSLGAEQLEPTRTCLQFRYSWSCAVAVAFTILICLLYVRSNIAQEFLYFDF